MKRDKRKPDVIVLNTCCIRDHADQKEKMSPSLLQDVSLNKKASPCSVAFPKSISSWDCNKPLTFHTY
ncbi:hypothetical protein ACHAW6_008055 [Cyclotella cf. meneghiniana]